MSKFEFPAYVTPHTEPSFHLVAILRPDMYQWFYEHFINVSVKCGRTAFFEFVDNYIDYSYKAIWKVN